MNIYLNINKNMNERNSYKPYNINSNHIKKINRPIKKNSITPALNSNLEIINNLTILIKHI